MTYLYSTCLQTKSGHLILSFTTRKQLKIVFKYFKRKSSYDFCFSNSANGKYEFSNSNNVEISSDGSITCKIPAILKSSCKIDVEFFPFDEQCCFMKFSSWTYDSNSVHVTHRLSFDETRSKQVDRNIYIEDAVDMSGYAESIEWDILSVSAKLINRNLNQGNIRKDEYYEGNKIYYFHLFHSA
jgi:hypothetical protein